MATDSTESTEFSIKIDEKDLDENGFVSVWNIANASTERDYEKARLIASKFIGFLCKQRADFVVVTPSDAKYLDEYYEKNNALLNNWKPDSDTVDIITQHAHVPHDVFTRLLTKKKFSPDKNYSPTRKVRLEWFTNEWSVG